MQCGPRASCLAEVGAQWCQPSRACTSLWVPSLPAVGALHPGDLAAQAAAGLCLHRRALDPSHLALPLGTRPTARGDPARPRGEPCALPAPLRTDLRASLFSCTGLTMGSTSLSPQEATLTDRQLLMDGPPPSSPETPQCPPHTGAAPDTTAGQPEPKAPSCPDVSPRLQGEGLGLGAAGESEASVPIWGTSETERWPGAAGPPAPFPSPVPPGTRDFGRRQVSVKPDCREGWLPVGRAGAQTSDEKAIARESSPSGSDTTETLPRAPRGGLAKDSGLQGRGSEGEQLPKVTEVTVCANNSKVSSTGEKVVLWTRWVGARTGGGLLSPVRDSLWPLAYREADRVILTVCQEQGAQPQTFRIISQQLGNKTPAEVSGVPWTVQQPTEKAGRPRGRASLAGVGGGVAGKQALDSGGTEAPIPGRLCCWERGCGQDGPSPRFSCVRAVALTALLGATSSLSLACGAWCAVSLSWGQGHSFPLP